MTYEARGASDKIRPDVCAIPTCETASLCTDYRFQQSIAIVDTTSKLTNLVNREELSRDSVQWRGFMLRRVSVNSIKIC